MDDLKVIPMMEKFFYDIAMKQKNDTGIDLTDIERREVSIKLRKVLDKVLDWYDGAGHKKTGEQPLTRFPIYSPLPDLDVKEASQYKDKLVVILNDFNARGCDREHIEAYFDSYLDKMKKGWGKALEDLKKKGG